MIRILFLDHTALPSGGELALLRQLPHLPVAAHVILGEDGELRRLMVERGISVEVVPIGPADRSSASRTSSVLNQVRAGIALASYALRLRSRVRASFDLIHTNSLKSAFYGAILSIISGVPVVWHVRDRWSRDYLPLWAVFLLRSMAKWIPSACIANSSSTAACVRRKDVFTIPSPCEIRPVPRQVAQRVATIGMVARIAPWKGQHLFLEAFADAFRGSDVRAVIAGGALFGEEAYLSHLRKLVSGLGITDQVDFRGHVDDVEAVYRSLDIAVCYSAIPEPFGQVVVEAMASGAVVVAANEGGPAETIRHDIDGVLVAPRDPAALKEALLGLVSDSVRRSELIAEGQRAAVAYAPEQLAPRYMAVYNAVRARGAAI